MRSEAERKLFVKVLFAKCCEGHHDAAGGKPPGVQAIGRSVACWPGDADAAMGAACGAQQEAAMPPSKHARRLEGGGVCGGRRQKRQILLAMRGQV
ncbi:MAG TPA: hypothetical protein IAB73_02880 [Candidatus Onthenecus intestinigallinarum]|uniref:Uncharacterized protein n=1 Tax=Candidatus Onthenecus intestinigallinarum TaxID=2840875 RepID=A0A9D0Z954_9FIRM|nr:hypothetical protein [Candidatus Onthenecus intestinigallinarum]